MTKLRELVEEYRKNPIEFNKQIDLQESKTKLKDKKILPIYYIQKKNPVPIFLKQDVPKMAHHKYIRTLGLEKGSKLQGDIIELYKNLKNGKRFGIKIGRK